MQQRAFRQDVPRGRNRVRAAAAEALRPECVDVLMRGVFVRRIELSDGLARRRLIGHGRHYDVERESWYSCASVKSWLKCRTPPVTWPCVMKCQVSSPKTDLSVKVCVSSCWKVVSLGPVRTRQFGKLEYPRAYRKPVPCSPARSIVPANPAWLRTSYHSLSDFRKRRLRRSRTCSRGWFWTPTAPPGEGVRRVRKEERIDQPRVGGDSSVVRHVISAGETGVVERRVLNQRPVGRVVRLVVEIVAKPAS